MHVFMNYSNATVMKIVSVMESLHNFVGLIACLVQFCPHQAHLHPFCSGGSPAKEKKIRM